MKDDQIEFQELLAESNPGGAYNIRLTRVKYRDNPQPCMDIRTFQRGCDSEGENVYHPTKKGVQLSEDSFQRLISKWKLIPEKLLHREILNRAYHLFLAGEFESAVIQAFKAVEVRVREAAGLQPEDVGTKLMRKAFDPENGPLTDQAVPLAEREALAHLFASGIGLYKNPCSHRHVEMDYHESFEMLNLASHLMKQVDLAIEKISNKTMDNNR
ncbi:MAG: TIGR02391 family protein [Sedimentisphaerales bacterium]|jgi:uncharacterized protein (TIGR02391 family)